MDGDNAQVLEQVGKSSFQPPGASSKFGDTGQLAVFISYFMDDSSHRPGTRHSPAPAAQRLALARICPSTRRSDQGGGEYWCFGKDRSASAFQSKGWRAVRR